MPWFLLALGAAVAAISRAWLVLQGPPDPAYVEREVLVLVASMLAAAGLGTLGYRRLAAVGAEEKILRDTLDTASDAMIVTDTEDRILYVNRHTMLLFGYKSTDLVGQYVSMLMPERYRKAHSDRQQAWRCEPRHRTLGTEETVFGRHHDGSEFPVELTVAPLRTPRGVLAIGSIRDVRERHRSAEKLQQSESRYRTIVDDVLDTSRVGVCVVGADARVSWVNRAYEQYFGVTRSAIAGMEAQRLLEEILLPRVEDPAAFRAAIGGPGADHFELHVLPGAARTESWLECWVQTIDRGMHKGGRIEQYTDVTERRRAEKTIRLFAQIAKSIQLGLIVYRLEDEADDRTLRVVTVNPAGESLFGMSSEEILGRTIDELFPGLREKGVPARLAGVARTGAALEVPDFLYGDERVAQGHWSFRAFPLPDCSVGVAFERVAQRPESQGS